MTADNPPHSISTDNLGGAGDAVYASVVTINFNAAPSMNQSTYPMWAAADFAISSSLTYIGINNAGAINPADAYDIIENSGGGNITISGQISTIG